MNPQLIRVIVAPALLIALAGCLWIDYLRNEGPAAIALVVAAFAVVSYRELCAMGRLKGVKTVEWAGLASVLASYAVLFWSKDPWTHLPIVGAALTVVVLVLLVLRPREYGPPDAAYTVFAFVYISLLAFVFWEKEQDRKDWLHWLLFLVCTNKGSDIAAFVFGKLFGRRKMAPEISPNKTWEGAGAGLIAGTVLGAWALGHMDGMTETLRVWTMALVVTVAAQTGDLVKSTVKRWAGVKDSGRLLPEFGGALDMVDSFILSAPVAALLLVLFF
jgi:phosphatidate cytidylyltransferase